MDSTSYNLYKREKASLHTELKNALKLNNELHARQVLMKIGYNVPVEAFTWITFRGDPSRELLDLLCHRKLLADEFVDRLINAITISEVTIFDVLVVVLRTHPNLARNDIFFAQELLSNGNPCSLAKFPVSNISKNYVRFIDCSHEIILECIYYAQPKILEMMLEMLKKYKVCYNFDPLTPGKQRSVFEWLIANLRNIRHGQLIGWRTGPDSGKWPSTDSEDYREVYNLLKYLM